MRFDMNHIMQHSDNPTWCINCGTFAEWCEGECKGEPGKFDSGNPENFKRMLSDVFGPQAVKESA